MIVIVTLAMVTLTLGSPITSTPTTVTDEVDRSVSATTVAQLSSSTNTPEEAEAKKSTLTPELPPKYTFGNNDREEGAGLRYDNIPIYALDSAPTDDGVAEGNSRPVVTNLSEEEIKTLIMNSAKKNEILSYDTSDKAPVIDFFLKKSKNVDLQEKKIDSKASIPKKDFFEMSYGTYIQQNKDARSVEGKLDDSTTSKEVTKPNPTATSMDVSRLRFQNKHRQFPFAFEDTPIASKWSPYLDDAFYPLSAFPEA